MLDFKDSFPNTPDLPKEAWLNRLRIYRNRLLTESDFAMLPDAPTNKDKWIEYRQKLRDLPANTVDPENPVFPKLPE